MLVGSEGGCALCVGISVLYEQKAPVGDLGRGTHYSVYRANIPKFPEFAHDFAVIWDEDHDERVFSVINELWARGELWNVLAIGERKACLSLVLKDTGIPTVAKMVDCGFQTPDGDFWNVETMPFPGTRGSHASLEDYRYVVNADTNRTYHYLFGIMALHQLGSKQVSK